MTTLERIWFAYLAAVVGVALAVDGGGDPRHQPIPFLIVHGAILVVQLVVIALHRRGALRAARIVRGVSTPIACVSTFSSLAMLLPAVHPEPYEYVWLGLDLRLFGGDVTQPLFASLSPVTMLGLQIVYATFYALPVLGVLSCGLLRGAVAFDRAIAIVVGSFLCSYLGYLLFPTLGPCVVYAAGGEPTDGLTGVVHRAIDRGEANPWDCFPSGHTMLTLTSLLIVRRWARPLFWLFLSVALPLVASTLLLRYHWPADVLVGILLVWPVARGIDRLLDRDGVPQVPLARAQTPEPAPVT